MNFDEELPEGTIAVRVYVTPSPTGHSAVIAFTLADKDADTLQAKFARETGAVAYGLVSIVGWPDAPEYPMIWTHDRTQFGIVVADEDTDLDEETQAIIARYLAVFFKDIADVAPELGSLKLKATRARPDRTLH